MKSLEEIRIAVPGGHLANYVVGEGPVVIFLHGGPGDTHHYMRRMAEPLFKNHRCVFFDQRGTGGSIGFERKAENFQVDRLLQDLEAVHDHFSKEPVSLVGHSWGAMYGLFASIRHPERFSRAALISMGPLDKEAAQTTGDHLLSVLTPQEQRRWRELRTERNSARDRDDQITVLAADEKLMSLRVKAWIFNPSLRAQFLAEYNQDPPPDRVVNKLVWESAETWFDWESVASLKSKVWICYGANDSVPLAQFQRLTALSSRIQLTVFERCGHIPWLEHPTTFYRDLNQFLGG